MTPPPARDSPPPRSCLRAHSLSSLLRSNPGCRRITLPLSPPLMSKSDKNPYQAAAAAPPYPSKSELGAVDVTPCAWGRSGGWIRRRLASSPQLPITSTPAVTRERSTPVRARGARSGGRMRRLLASHPHAVLDLPTWCPPPISDGGRAAAPLARSRPSSPHPQSCCAGSTDVAPATARRRAVPDPPPARRCRARHGCDAIKPDVPPPLLHDAGSACPRTATATAPPRRQAINDL
uniref:Uncharacterized protein n=1 Tax=Oryza meridionalis TaxID=40149 RepID=A0A0E0DAH2_9ORYZ